MSIGFKEWALVCEALGTGEQSVILRKGGIAEGREGFRFKHEEFFLFPTLFHEQVTKTKLPQDTPLPHPAEGQVRIQYFAKAEWAELVKEPAAVAALAPFHIWKDSEIEQRFRYDDVQGVNVAFVRVYRLEPAWTFEDSPKYGGCRSWVTLPDLPAGTSLTPVLDDAAHARRAVEVLGAMAKA
ncbi:MAG TPA: DUF1802 family protein [Chthoniobacteraceae bacterium]|nr:DUF1802 family protein [Chthoniobacteraceae bacterium]